MTPQNIPIIKVRKVSGSPLPFRMVLIKWKSVGEILSFSPTDYFFSCQTVDSDIQ